eukprot:scaffold575830_cov47-Prasinocladus_malaysianus.AAC.1
MASGSPHGKDLEAQLAESVLVKHVAIKLASHSYIFTDIWPVWERGKRVRPLAWGYIIGWCSYQKDTTIGDVWIALKKAHQVRYLLDEDSVIKATHQRHYI